MKRITAAVLVLLLVLCGCGKKAVEENNNIDSSSDNVVSDTFDTPDSDSSIDTDSSTDSDITGTDTSTEKNTDTSKNKKDTDIDSEKSSKKNSDSDKKKNSDKDTDLSKSKTTSSAALSSSSAAQTKPTEQTVTYTIGGADDPIRNVAPENVQQYIINEEPIVVDPEPESTYVNDYENVDPNEKVDDSWFDDCVIMGDSLTVGLSLYNDANNPFGNAKFVCASSLSYWNSQWDLYRPGNVHPMYNGRKILLEDAPVVTGAKKAIITLGMNDIGIWGPEGTIEQARSLLYKIRAKSPDLQIYLETVTPMLYGNQKAHLNNQLIRQFNSNLRNFAEQEGCGFLNSYDAFADSNGNLPYDLCSDPGGLGLHFNFKACAIWAEFLKANVGSLDPKPEPESTVSEPVSESSTDTDNTTDTDSEISSENGTVTESAVQEN